MSNQRSAPGDVEILQHIDEALAADHPLALLELVSGLVAITDPRGRHPFERDAADDVPTYGEVLESMLGVDLPQTTAVLTGLAALAEDELLAARVRREVARRNHDLPAWLGQLAGVDVYRTVEMVHVLGGGDNIMIGARAPSGHEFTALVYIDHDLGSVAKDGFLVPMRIAALVEETRAAADDLDTSWNDLDLADARVRVGGAIDVGAVTYPPYETETWPGCRPLVEWLLRKLPSGGRGYERPEWTDSDRRRLMDAFFASPYGAGLDDADSRSLLETLVRYGTDDGNGDPLRWSQVAVEILLTDWLPRKVMADVDCLSRAPDLLRAFVQYSHAHVGIRDALTDEALDAVDELEPEYQELIRLPRAQGAAELLAAMGALDEEDGDDADLVGVAAESVLDALRRLVGGDEALRTVDAEPLPDEVLDWTGIPDDVRDRVDEVRRLCDDCCDQLFDVEHRTACRRLLARVASVGPHVFRRKGAAATAAGAICWLVGKANDDFSLWGLQVQQMLAHLGLRGSVSQRAEAMLRAADLEPEGYLRSELEGAPEFLVARRRAEIVELRDRWSARLET